VRSGIDIDGFIRSLVTDAVEKVDFFGWCSGLGSFDPAEICRLSDFAAACSAATSTRTQLT
jgi:hypothetical protein